MRKGFLIYKTIFIYKIIFLLYKTFLLYALIRLGGFSFSYAEGNLTKSIAKIYISLANTPLYLVGAKMCTFVHLI